MNVHTLLKQKATHEAWLNNHSEDHPCYKDVQHELNKVQMLIDTKRKIHNRLSSLLNQEMEAYATTG